MLNLDHINQRKAEIANARDGFVKQLTQLEADTVKLRSRISNIDGALELINLFEQDIAAQKRAEAAAEKSALEKKQAAEKAAADQAKAAQAEVETQG